MEEGVVDVGGSPERAGMRVPTEPAEGETNKHE